MTFLVGLIGKPYELGAAGPDRFDCYGLTRHVQHELAGIKMADVPFPITGTRAQAEAMLVHPERKLWDEVSDYEIRDLDIVLMGNVMKRDFHLGTFIRDGARGGVLHMNQDNGAVFDDIPTLKGIGFNYLRFFRRTTQ